MSTRDLPLTPALEPEGVEWIEWWDSIAPETKKLAFGSPRVLVVDDDPLFCRTMARVGDKLGIEVRTCNTLTSLAALKRNERFDAAIVDYFFGELKGPQLSYLWDSHTPVVLTSSSERSRIQTEGWPRNIQYFVPKSRGPEVILRSALKTVGKFSADNLGLTVQRLTTHDSWRVWALVGALTLALAGIYWLTNFQTPTPRYWDEAPRTHNIGSIQNDQDPIYSGENLASFSNVRRGPLPGMGDFTKS